MPQVWLERRTAYTRATGVMSMVGYLLGLGDRHPSNLMLDRYSGKLLHIDFGDCFEASMHREKFPEKVRLLCSALTYDELRVLVHATSCAVLPCQRAAAGPCCRAVTPLICCGAQFLYIAAPLHGHAIQRNMRPLRS
jgi:Phosphatidylinositol 3- and 4-kinase